jgi:hypothetical protein
MAKAIGEKSLRISSKPASKGVLASYVQGQKPAKVPKPKSLTPLKKK